MDTLESNKLLAEFMGLKHHHGYDTWNIPLDMNCDSARIWRLEIQGGYQFKSKLLKFDKSWDWLMPVIDKIGDELGFNVTISRSFATITVTADSKGFFETTCSHSGRLRPLTKIEATYKVVIAFIKWYNDDNKGLNENQILGQSTII